MASPRWLAMLVVVAGCAWSTPAAPPTTATAVVTRSAPPVQLTRAWFVPGERIELDVSLRGIGLGRIETTTGAPGLYDGRRAVVIKSRATGTGMVALVTDYVGELTSTIDADDGVSLYLYKEEWFSMLGTPDHDVFSRTYPHDDRRLDTHAAIGAIRGWSSRPGDRATVTLDIAGNGFDIALLDDGRAIDPRTNTPAVRYTGSVPSAVGTLYFSLWISDDDARVPLKLQMRTPWGTARAELADYDAPDDE